MLNFRKLLQKNLLFTGVDVIWRSNNGGAPRLHIENYLELEEDRLDGELLDGLEEAISRCKSEKVFVVLHLNNSHGPDYDHRYPPEFARFTPTKEETRKTDRSHEGLINSYDNTIVYTDFLLSRVIELLKGMYGWRRAMMFVSDHGESLGEGGFHMHGVPNIIAPKEQFMIPFIVWTSDDSVRTDESEELTQYYVFHSVMNFLGMRSPIYDDSLNIFK